MKTRSEMLNKVYKSAAILRIGAISRDIEQPVTHCQHKISLHLSRRMAWKNLRHGEAVNFLSPRKNIEQSLTSKCVLIKFYKISKDTKQPLAVSHWPLAKQRNTNQKQNIKHNAEIKSAQLSNMTHKDKASERREAEGE